MKDVKSGDATDLKEQTRAQFFCVSSQEQENAGRGEEGMNEKRERDEGWGLVPHVCL
jgi:hypothetical protein